MGGVTVWGGDTGMLGGALVPPPEDGLDGEPPVGLDVAPPVGLDESEAEAVSVGVEADWLGWLDREVGWLVYPSPPVAGVLGVWPRVGADVVGARLGLSLVGSSLGDWESEGEALGDTDDVPPVVPPLGPPLWEAATMPIAAASTSTTPAAMASSRRRLPPGLASP